MSEGSVVPAKTNKLERMLVLDQSADAGSVLALLEVTADLWNIVHDESEYAELMEWALIYSMKETVIGAGEYTGRAKWQVMKIEKDKPLAITWEGYCLSHLGLTPGAASNKKRNWEVFVIKFGYHFRDLRRAGVQRLNVSRSCFDKGWATERLTWAVFGRPHVCSECGAYIVFEGFAPENCPECDDLFVPVAPKTVAEVQIIVDAIKAENRPDKSKVHIEADIEKENGLLIILPWLVDGETRIDLPSWEIPLLGSGEIGSNGGIPQHLEKEALKLIRKAFK